MPLQYPRGGTGMLLQGRHFSSACSAPLHTRQGDALWLVSANIHILSDVTNVIQLAEPELFVQNICNTFPNWMTTIPAVTDLRPVAAGQVLEVQVESSTTLTCYEGRMQEGSLVIHSASPLPKLSCMADGSHRAALPPPCPAPATSQLPRKLLAFRVTTTMVLSTQWLLQLSVRGKYGQRTVFLAVKWCASAPCHECQPWWPRMQS